MRIECVQCAWVRVIHGADDCGCHEGFEQVEQLVDERIRTHKLLRLLPRELLRIYSLWVERAVIHILECNRLRTAHLCSIRYTVGSVSYFRFPFPIEGAQDGCHIHSLIECGPMRSTVLVYLNLACRCWFHIYTTLISQAWAVLYCWHSNFHVLCLPKCKCTVLR